MPMSTWDEVAGERCLYCHRPASHFYGMTPMCCQCHGGDLVSEEETAKRNPRGTWVARIAQELLGWKRVIRLADRIVYDDGCMWNGRCNDCYAIYETTHKESCPHMNSKAVWQIGTEVYSDTGDPKRWVSVGSWNPLKDCNHAEVILKEIVTQTYGDYQIAIHPFPSPNGITIGASNDSTVISVKDESLAMAICMLAIGMLDVGILTVRESEQSSEKQIDE